MKREPRPDTADAFMSYSSRDGALARQLHQALERGFHRLPAQYRRELRELRIIIDREEFDAGVGLSDLVESHLERSTKLLVLCSPASVDESRWVSEEISRFRAIHGGSAPILPILLQADDPVSWHDIPAPLRREGELDLWVDAREVRIGEPISEQLLLRIHAFILGVPYAQLNDRHARYHRARKRRIIASVAVATGTLLLATIAGIYVSATPEFVIVSTHVPLAPPLAPAIACSNGRVALGGEDGEIDVMDASERIETIPTEPGETSPKWVRPAGDGFVANSRDSATLTWYDYDGALRRRIVHPEGLNWTGTAPGAEAEVLYMGDEVGGVWQAVGDAAAERVAVSPHRMPEQIEALAWNRSQREIVALDSAGAVFSWSPDSGLGPAVSIPEALMLTSLVVVNGQWLVLAVYNAPKAHGVILQVDRDGTTREITEAFGVTTYLVPGVDDESFLQVGSDGRVGSWSLSAQKKSPEISFEPGWLGGSRIPPVVGVDREAKRYCVIDAKGLHWLEPKLRSALGFYLPTL